uniref:Major facilitator superfamily (MFS) profile domain-containing protein n=1 Tax=Daucus carota subsp. sativus TaxID=79200 RepID=A0A175YDR1_DAUCS
MRSEKLTLIMVNLAGIMERADESLLPGVYKEVGQAFDIDPTSLGSLTLFRSMVQSACYPLAAYLALHYNRAHVIALGAFLWATATFLVGFSSSFLQVAISRGLNGIGLAIVIPAIQSLIADSTDDSNRGVAFGWLQFTGGLGSIIGGFVSVLIASTSFMGIPGWRIAFHLVGLISVVVGILVRLFAHDPRFSDGKPQIPHQPFWSQTKNMYAEAKTVINIPSFQIIVAQGISGSCAWSALSFAPMWLELIGFSHKTTALLWTTFAVGTSIGGLCGGKLGDTLAKYFPDSGRIILSQISAGSAIPLAAILLLAIPDNPSTALTHEIVPEKSRTSIYALDCSFESVLASFAPPTVGILAQYVFGYKPVPKGSTGSQETKADRENAAPLAKALYAAIFFPMVICVFIYSFLYCTYPRDRDQARMYALGALEIEYFESEIRNSGKEYLQLSVTRSDELHERDRDNQVEGSLDFDENDTKRLLSQ